MFIMRTRFDWFCNNLLIVLAVVLVWMGAVDLATAAIAQEETVSPAKGPTEMWAGTLDIDPLKLRLQLNLTLDEQGQVISGTLLSPDQASTPIELDRVTRTAEKIEFQIDRSGVRYEGLIDESGKLASGTFSQQNAAVPLDFRKIEQALSLVHQATWVGEYKTLMANYEFQIRVFADEAGESSAKLDVFSEGKFGIPCDYKVEGPSVTLNCRLIGLEFRGVIDGETGNLNGLWKQRDIEFPIVLQACSVADSRPTSQARPQSPMPPFSYQVKQFQVPINQVDPKFEPNVILAGVLSIPPGESKFPTVLLVSGIGAQDRDHTGTGHKMFSVLADHLANQGYVVARYDDRGVGDSTGNHRLATTMNFTNDAEAMFMWLRGLPMVDPQRIIILGHSEGAMIASLVAMRQPELAGVIFLAGHGVDGRSQMILQRDSMLQAAGVPEANIAQQKRFITALLDLALSDAELDKPTIDEMAAKEFGDLTPLQKFELGIYDIETSSFEMMQTRWMKFYLKFDPRSSLPYVQVPLLSLFGENDRQSVPQVNGTAIEEAVQMGQNPDFQQKILPGLNHYFQPSASGLPSEYSLIETTIDESALIEISNWMNQRFQK